MIFQIVLAALDFSLLAWVMFQWWNCIQFCRQSQDVIAAYRAENEALKVSLRFHVAAANMYLNRSRGNEPLAQKWLEESQRIFNETFSDAKGL